MKGGIPYRGHYLRLMPDDEDIGIVCEGTGRLVGRASSVRHGQGIIDAWYHEQQYGPIPPRGGQEELDTT